MTSVGFISVLYSLTSVIVIAVYIPQILSVSKDNSGAQSLSLFTWYSWTASSIIACLYALIVVNDTLLIIISSFHALGCGSVSLIASYKRWQYAARI